MPVPGIMGALEATEASKFPGEPPFFFEDFEVVAEDDLRRMFAISPIATRKSLKSSAISALVAPWHRAENGPHSKNVSKSDSGRG